MSKKSSRLLPILSLCLVICMSISSMAAFIPPSAEVDPQDATYAYYWRDAYIESDVEQSPSDDDPLWKMITRAHGPGTLTAGRSYTYTATASGLSSISMTKAEINAQFGFSVGQSQGYSASFSYNLAAGESKSLWYCPIKMKYTIARERIRIRIADGQETSMGVYRAYVYEFSGWEFDVREYS